MSTIGTVELIASINTSNYKKGAAEIDRANKDISSSTDQADKSTKTFSGSVSTFAKGAAKAGVVAIAAVGVASIVAGKQFIDSASNLQSLRASFESLTGSGGAATDVLRQMYEFGKVTAFTNEQIQTTARSFLAAGVSTQDLGRYMQQAGDIAGATGADLASFTLPLTQAIARGKLQTQDFYQILNSGAGAFRKNLEEEVVKRGLGNLQDALSDGTVTTEVLTAALENATKVGGFAFNGAIKQANTYAGRLSNMQEAITNVGLAILGVDAITGEVKAGSIFDNISNSVKTLTQFLSDNKQGFIDFANAVIKPIGDAFNFVADGVKMAIEFFKPLIDYVTSNQRVMEVLKTTLLVIGGILGGILFVAIGAIVVVVTALTALIEILVNVFEFLIEAGINLSNALVPIFANIINFTRSLVEGFEVAYTAIVSVFTGLPKFLAGVWSSIVSIFTNIGTSIGNAVANAFKSVMNGIISFVESTINNIANLINNLAKGIDDILPGDQSGFRIPKVNLPRLAEGGIVSSATIAMIGEGSEPEAVIPLSKLDKMLNNGNSSSDNSRIEINVSGVFATSKQEQRAIAEVIAQRLKEIQKSKALSGGIA